MASILSTIFNTLTKGSRGTLSKYVLNAPPQFGQPLPQQLDDSTGLLITPERMREIALKTPTIGSCLNATLDYVCNIPIKIRNVDPSQPADPDRLEFIRTFLAQPNGPFGVDTWKHYIAKTARDLFTLGMAGTEIIPNAAGRPYGIYALDSARLKIDYDEHGNILGYDMINARGVPIQQGDGTHAWKPDELILFRRDPISESVYSSSRVQQMFVLGMIESLMLHFIGSRFTNSNVPYGIYDLGDVSEQELVRAVEMWNEQSRSPHEILVTGSKNGGKWTPFAYALKDLEAHQILADVQTKIMALCGVTKNEFGDSEDINKSNGYNLSFTFKKRAIEPLLSEICETLTSRLLWNSFGFHDLELYYQEIDSRDELLQAQIDEIYLRNGVASINQTRNRRGDPSEEGGDELLLQTGTNWIPVRLISRFAEAQLAGIEAMVAATESGTGSSDIKPPLIRPPQIPEKFTTPGGSGSSSPKFEYPNKQAQSTSPPRGQVHQLRQIGHRND
jgi:hypothetical protein